MGSDGIAARGAGAASLPVNPFLAYTRVDPDGGRSRFRGFPGPVVITGWKHGREIH
jgi:hypothetical protein